MRPLVARFFLTASLLLVSANAVRSQEGPREEKQKQETEQENSQMTWKLINTGLFAVAFGFLLWKAAPRFFNARSADIQRAIREATGLKMDADLRYSEIDRKMATLPEEVNRVRAQGAIEMEREHARIQRETEEELRHIQRNVQFENEALRNESAHQIRRRTATQAFDLAERRLRERAGATDASGDVSEFIDLVDKGQN